MHVQFFGRLADLSGARRADIPDDMQSGADLRAWLHIAHPQLSDILAHPGTRLVLNNEIVAWDTPLHGARDIAIIPVVSGG
jgi:molybdopterin converting factor small subunit